MKMGHGHRADEIKVLAYRLFLAFVFYQAARFFFWVFNRNLIPVKTVSEYFKISFYGTAFDTTAILYVNALFILLSLLPLLINTKKTYQKFLFYIYFITNGITYAFNFGDAVYYKFSQARLSNAAFLVAQNEANLSKILFVSVGQNPLVLIVYLLLMIIWILLYHKVKLNHTQIIYKPSYYFWSVIYIAIASLLTVGGIRGDFRHSTRPLSLVDASKQMKNPLHSNLVLNSVFSFFRTLGSNHFKEVHFVEQQFIEENIFPVKQYSRQTEQRPNIVIIIVESFAREYSGAFNKNRNIPDYISYTPFIDSLAQHSLIFPESFGNGRQSIHAMSSILAGIPTLQDSFTGSPYANQPIESIVSVCNSLGYDTSFYHGAPNGSMGFQGFASILGFKNYYGIDEYDNEDDFDGMWAIWDEPFLQYFAKNSGKKTPFLTTVFTASSHHPFKIPEKYAGKFRKGPLQMHEPIQYTDYSIKKYFETAAKQPWYHNTIFVITGDHINQIYYPEYEKTMNRFAIPILFFSPNKEYQLQGVSKEWAQQADIYPTLVDLIGYNKKFRSWGRSLVTPEKYPHILVNSDSVTENFIIGNCIYLFNGKEVTGIYRKDDLGLVNNLINVQKSQEMKTGMKTALAWYQDYMYRIVNRKLK